MQRTETLHADRFVVLHSVGPKQDGERLDRFLSERYRKRTRESMKRWIQSGFIRVKRDDRPYHPVGKAKPSTQLLSGDFVEVLVRRLPEPEVDFEYKVLHEDESILVISKPGNLPVHPAGCFFFHTLLIHLRTQGFTQPLPADREYFLAHRIDRETSGVLVLAKSRETCANLIEQFAARKTKKRYLAIVKGKTDPEFFSNLPLGKPGSTENGKIRLMIHPTPIEKGGQTAETRFVTLGSGKEYSLVECFPKTGRQHQIRVHLAQLGHPILGDKLYSLSEDEAYTFFRQRPNIDVQEFLSGEDQGPQGIPNDDRYNLPPRFVSMELQHKLKLDRHALHAAGIEFVHPSTGQKMKFEAEFPKDLQDILDRDGIAL